MKAAYEGQEDVMSDLVSEVVTTYHPESVKDSEHMVKAYQ